MIPFGGEVSQGKKKKKKAGREEHVDGYPGLSANK